MNGPQCSPASRAAQSRALLGLADNTPVDLVKAFRNAHENLSIVFRPMSASISGMCVRHNGFWLIVINTSKSLGHQHFTLAHEYYHLSYEDGLEGRACSVGRGDAKGTEKEADQFASALLMPIGGIAERLARRTGSERPNVDASDIIDLEQYFGVSHAAMLVRLCEYGVITSSQAQTLKPAVIDTARRLGYDASLYRANNRDLVLSPLAEMAEIARANGLISLGKYEQLMLEGGLADLLYGDEGDEGPGEDV